MVIVLLSIGLGILTLVVLGLLRYTKKLEQQIILLDREQHDQNKMIMQLVLDDRDMKEMLLQHIEILKYLCDQDPMLSKTRIPYTGPIGEA